jgi:hypothetical protein
MNIRELMEDLQSRGFSVGNDGTMNFAEGSISHYKKCSVSFGYRLWGDMAGEWFYPVRYESFAESGQPEVDHHTISEYYVAESQIVNFVRNKGILSNAEREERWTNLRKRLGRG